VRRATREGPQHVTVHGREEVAVVGADDFRRFAGERTGEALIEAMQGTSHRPARIETARLRFQNPDGDLAIELCSRVRYTAPIPPDPSEPTITCGPIDVPGCIIDSPVSDAPHTLPGETADDPLIQADTLSLGFPREASVQ
jgi:hypothetical protein